MQSPRGDDAGCGGVDLGFSLDAKSVGHLAEDHRRPQRPLKGIVGIGQVASGDEAEQVMAIPPHRAEQPACRGALRCLPAQQAVQALFEISAVLGLSVAHVISPDRAVENSPLRCVKRLT